MPATPPAESTSEPDTGPMGEPLDAAQTADLAVATWRRIDDALWPIIGHAGMAALFKRSLYLARVDQPALTAIVDVEIASGDFAPLRETLTQQTSADAAAALLKTFLDLLTSLIGAELAERLLRSVLDNDPSSGEPVQDTSS